MFMWSLNEVIKRSLSLMCWKSWQQLALESILMSRLRLHRSTQPWNLWFHRRLQEQKRRRVSTSYPRGTVNALGNQFVNKKETCEFNKLSKVKSRLRWMSTRDKLSVGFEINRLRFSQSNAKVAFERNYRLRLCSVGMLRLFVPKVICFIFCYETSRHSVEREMHLHLLSSLWSQQCLFCCSQTLVKLISPRVNIYDTNGNNLNWEWELAG